MSAHAGLPEADDRRDVSFIEAEEDDCSLAHDVGVANGSNATMPSALKSFGSRVSRACPCASAVAAIAISAKPGDSPAARARSESRPASSSAMRRSRFRGTGDPTRPESSSPTLKFPDVKIQNVDEIYQTIIDFMSKNDATSIAAWNDIESVLHAMPHDSRDDIRRARMSADLRVRIFDLRSKHSLSKGGFEEASRGSPAYCKNAKRLRPPAMFAPKTRTARSSSREGA